MRTCAVEGCDARSYCRGWCTRHYQRWRAHGEPEAILTGRGTPLVERFLARVVLEPPPPGVEGWCWAWHGSVARSGYGTFAVAHDVVRRAHVWSFEHWHGPVPAGLEVHHRCEVRRCVNPDHLAAVTHRQNVMASDTPARRNAEKTHCPAGHEYTPENTYRSRRGGSVMRTCRACRRERARDRRRLR